MTLSLQEAFARIQGLHADLHSISTDVDAQQRVWKKVNKDARVLIDQHLKSEGIASVDDLAKKIKEEIKDAGIAAKYQKILDEFTPPDSFWGAAKEKFGDPIEDAFIVAKFAAYGSLGNTLINWNSAAGKLSLEYTKAMGALNSAYQARIGANYANAAIRGINIGLNPQEIQMIEQQIRLNVIYEAAEGEEVVWEEAMGNALKNGQKGIAAAQEALRAARSACVWALVISAGVFIGEYFYTKYKNAKLAEEMEADLKQGILELCTVRLYATQDKEMAAVYSSLVLKQRDIAKAIIAGKPVNDLVESYIADAKELQTDSLTDERLNEILESLKTLDEGTKTDYDPTLDQMKAHHQKTVDKIKGEIKEEGKKQ
ncbi:hypothetical protein DL93DRAFT_2088179 [Clavulina sp. PMI_390]|nr:hypothetical protein DL93DRAFT_2088179 [Clavulina sp. PMI_390]